MAAAAINGSFTGPKQTAEFNGFLFDFDGTIIDSTAAIVKHWTAFGQEQGIDPQVILWTSHGRRSIDTLQEIAPSLANWEYVSKVEGELPRKYGSDGKELPGARETLDALTALKAPWAIVTSGSAALVAGWMGVLKLPEPPIKVVAEDVAVGKPDPACYRLGKKKIGLDDGANILVIEDAPAGIKAGKAAGCKVLGLATTHSIERLEEAGADWIVNDLASVKVLDFDNGVTRLEFSNLYVRQ